MKLRFLLAGLLFWQAISRAEPTLPMPATGANVDESRVEVALYVDPANGEAADDDKHGTADAPFATLRYACAAATKIKDANRGVRLVVANGTYRETAEIPAPTEGRQDTDAPLIVEAAERDQVTIDGADTEGWTPSTWKVENGRWTHPWPSARGPVSSPSPASPVYRRGNLLFVNDIALRQVNAAADLVPGSFWINLPGPVQSKRGATLPGASVVIQPPEGTALDEAIIQAAARPYGMSVRGRRNVVVRGIVFQHAADPKGVGAAQIDMAGLNLIGCANVLVEDVLSQWNDGAGINALSDADVTLRRVRLLHNGSLALLAQQTRNALAEDCEASFNGFRAEWAGMPNVPSYGAALYVSGDRLTWRRLHAVGNLCRGLTLGNCTNLLVEESVFTNNLANGLLVYFCPGPVEVRRCVVAGTKRYPGVNKETTGNGGVVLTGSADVTLQSNVVAGNVTTQLALYEPLFRGKGRSERLTLRHNVFSSTQADQLLYKWLDGDESKGPVVPDYRTLDTDENCFWNPASAEGFAVFTLSSYLPSTSPNATETRREQPGMNFDLWREWLASRVHSPASVGTEIKSPDAHSFWQDPGFVDAAEGDFRLRGKSPVTDWELQSEDTAGIQ